MRSPGMLDHGNESLLTRYRRTARHHRGIRGRTNEKMPVALPRTPLIRSRLSGLYISVQPRDSGFIIGLGLIGALFTGGSGKTETSDVIQSRRVIRHQGFSARLRRTKSSEIL
jgi:hypothetical protein